MTPDILLAAPGDAYHEIVPLAKVPLYEIDPEPFEPEPDADPLATP
ncbi:MAG: hypothetical protein HY720_19840 [Planctomycetes bacterium]|nr:hypothetical protein [Planctomycetota bacterium]